MHGLSQRRPVRSINGQHTTRKGLHAQGCEHTEGRGVGERHDGRPLRFCGRRTQKRPRWGRQGLLPTRPRPLTSLIMPLTIAAAVLRATLPWWPVNVACEARPAPFVPGLTTMSGIPCLCHSTAPDLHGTASHAVSPAHGHNGACNSRVLRSMRTFMLSNARRCTLIARSCDARQRVASVAGNMMLSDQWSA